MPKSPPITAARAASTTDDIVKARLSVFCPLTFLEETIEQQADNGKREAVLISDGLWQGLALAKVKRAARVLRSRGFKVDIAHGFIRVSW